MCGSLQLTLSIYICIYLNMKMRKIDWIYSSIYRHDTARHDNSTYVRDLKMTTGEDNGLKRKLTIKTWINTHHTQELALCHRSGMVSWITIFENKIGFSRTAGCFEDDSNKEWRIWSSRHYHMCHFDIGWDVKSFIYWFSISVNEIVACVPVVFTEFQWLDELHLLQWTGQYNETQRKFVITSDEVNFEDLFLPRCQQTKFNNEEFV